MTDNIKSSTKIKEVAWSYAESKTVDDIPWGAHKAPVLITLQGVNIELKQENGNILYKREGMQKKVNKNILSERGSLSFSPVEPFHHFPGLSAHLLIHFQQPLLIRPKDTRKIITTFPLEIAAFYERKGNDSIFLDLFSLVTVKHSLYGSIKSGLICRYWEGGIYSSIPEFNPLEQGLLYLGITNNMVRWAEINKAIFSAFGMKIYYNSQMASMQATMKINNEYSAETVFIDNPVKSGMKKAPERYGQKILSQTGRMSMEEGY